MVSDRVTSDGWEGKGRGEGRKGGDHVTAIKQIVRVGTTCSTVDKRAGEGQAAGKLAGPPVAAGKWWLLDGGEGKGRRA